MNHTPLLIFCLAGFALKAFAQNNIQANTENDSVSISLTDLTEINSKFADYAPVISADGSELMFTSRRPVTPQEIKKNKESLEHIYLSVFDTAKKQWATPQLLPPVINMEGRMNSAIALSNDGHRLLLYRDVGQNNDDISESVLKGTTWSEPVAFPEPINSKYLESSASISSDGKTIYFVSNRPGGMGKKDIWYCVQDSTGKWGEARNIGTPINTQEDEEAVFIHLDGKTLYFSSKGHGGYGGYDVFRSVYEDGQWGNPENMGKPINTADDDIFFVMAANGRTGYFSSNRSGGVGQQDIYQVTFTPLKKENKSKGPNLVLLKGTVLDEQTRMPLRASIEIIDNEKNKQVSNVFSNDSTGKFMVSLPSGKNYGVNINVPGYLFYSDNFNLSDTATYKEVAITIKSKKLEVGKEIVLNNIYYDFDKASLRNESVSELNKIVGLMKDNPTLKVEIASFTDNKGTDNHNVKLSRARTQTVLDYLITNGVDKERLIPKGYGKANPIASNETDEGRQMNRRTEFKILRK